MIEVAISVGNVTPQMNCCYCDIVSCVKSLYFDWSEAQILSNPSLDNNISDISYSTWQYAKMLAPLFKFHVILTPDKNKQGSLASL